MLSLLRKRFHLLPKPLNMHDSKNVKGFDVQGIVNFVTLVDHLFDIFNSRAIYKGQKGPITAKNFDATEDFLLKVKDILLNLRDITGKRVCEGKRCIAMLGFAVSIDSVLSLARDLLLGKSSVLQFFNL